VGSVVEYSERDTQKLQSLRHNPADIEGCIFPAPFTTRQTDTREIEFKRNFLSYMEKEEDRKQNMVENMYLRYNQLEFGGTRGWDQLVKEKEKEGYEERK
jgi:hypothetical protein